MQLIGQAIAQRHKSKPVSLIPSLPTIAFDGAAIVGFGRIVGDRSHVCLLTDIAVHPNYRGQKIASQIIKALLDEVKDCEKVFAHTSQAIGLYEKLGFVGYEGDAMALMQ